MIVTTVIYKWLEYFNWTDIRKIRDYFRVKQLINPRLSLLVSLMFLAQLWVISHRLILISQLSHFIICYFDKYRLIIYITIYILEQYWYFTYPSGKNKMCMTKCSVKNNFNFTFSKVSWSGGEIKTRYLVASSSNADLRDYLLCNLISTIVL